MKTIDFFNKLKILTTNHTLERFGNDADGGYVAPKEIIHNLDYLISVGVEDNYSFELDLMKLNKNLQTILVDGTIENFIPPNNVRFINKNLGLKNDNEHITLEELLKDIDSENIALQIDIEFDEWEIFDNLSIEILNKFKLIIIEIHFVLIDEEKLLKSQTLSPYFQGFYKNSYTKINKMLIKKYDKVITNFLSNFSIVHLHANNSLKLINHDGITFPPLLEVTFLNNTEITKSNLYLGELPISNLDLQNKKDREDLFNFYPFGVNI